MNNTKEDSETTTEFVSIYPWVLLNNNRLNLMICKPSNDIKKMETDSEELILDQIEKKKLKPFLLEILGYIRNNYMNYTSGTGKIGFLNKNNDYIFLFTIDNKIIIQPSNQNSKNKSISYMSKLILNSPNGAGFVNLHNNEYGVLINEEN